MPRARFFWSGEGPENRGGVERTKARLLGAESWFIMFFIAFLPFMLKVCRVFKEGLCRDGDRGQRPRMTTTMTSVARVMASLPSFFIFMLSHLLVNRV